MSCSDPPSGLDLLKSHQTAALTLANLGNSALLNGTAAAYASVAATAHQMSSPGRPLSGLSASEISALIPPLLSSDLVSKLAEERSNLVASHLNSPRIPNGIPLSISTTGSDDSMIMSRSFGDSRTPNSGSYMNGSLSGKLPVLYNGVDANRNEESGSASSCTRVPTIMYHGSANHIPISPVTTYQQQTFHNSSINSNSASTTLPVSKQESRSCRKIIMLSKTDKAISITLDRTKQISAQVWLEKMGSVCFFLQINHH